MSMLEKVPMRRMMAAVAIGWVGFALDRPVDIVSEPIRISLIFGSVLPLMVSLAWGWRAALVASIPGLAGFYPFAAWPQNGWGNLVASVLICLWFAVHGWASERRKSSPRWFNSPYVVEIGYGCFYALSVLTVLRWSFAFNPPPWAMGSPASMSMATAVFIAIKTACNNLLIVLLADSLLVPRTRTVLRIMGGALLVAAVLWMLDGAVTAIFEPGVSLWISLYSPEPDRLVTRLLMAALCLVAARLVVAAVLNRQRSDRELQRSRIELDHVLRTTSDGYCIIDGRGAVVDANANYARMSGYSLEELRRLHVADLEAVEDRASIHDHMERIRRAGADRFETRHRRKDGTVFDLEISILHHRVDEERFYCFLRDISERQRAVQAIDLERTLYKDLVATMPAGVYRCTVHNHKPLREDAWEQRVELNMVSDAFCHILGVTREACAADSAIVVSRIHPEDLAEFSRLNILGQTQLSPFNWEGRIIREGDVRWVHFASMPRRLDNGDVIWTGVIFDTTGRRRAEIDRQQLEDQLRQREKLDAIGQLAGGIAHDFNNQLSGILGFAELLGHRLKDRLLLEYLSHISNAAHRSADLTQRLLGFARMGKYRTQPVDIHLLVQEVAVLLRRGIDKRVSVILRLASPLSTVMGDPTQLQNVLLNLGLNARDAMPKGGDLVIATRRIDAVADNEDGGPQLEITICDTGIGMDADTLRRIFEPFFTTKGLGKGTGLGLASAYGVIKHHGGSIQVASQPGLGSTFTIQLPLVQGMEVERPRPREPAVAVHRQRIMVVDDEPVIVAVVDLVLRDRGYDPITFGDPVAALAHYREHWQDISLVILDMVMPRMGGRDLFLAMREINPRIRAVLSSGYSIEGEAQSIIDAGVQAFIQKPFEHDDLIRTVAEVLD